MEIKNLAQLKRAIANRSPFMIVKHHIKPEHTGQIRVPNIIQTNGFSSVVQNEPDHPVSTANGGKGYMMWYGKASNWVFEDGLCKFFDSTKNRPVWEIRFL